MSHFEAPRSHVEISFWGGGSHVGCVWGGIHPWGDGPVGGVGGCPVPGQSRYHAREGLAAQQQSGAALIAADLPQRPLTGPVPAG